MSVWDKYKVELVGGSAGGGGGMRFEFGEEAPEPSLGQPGDVYLNTSNGDFYLNQNGEWNQVANLQGPTGPQGDAGPQGDTGPSGADGQDGQDAEQQFTPEQVDQLLALIEGED